MKGETRRVEMKEYLRERERKVLQVVKRQKKVDTLTKNKLDT